MSELLHKLLGEMEIRVEKKSQELFPPGIKNLFVRNRKGKARVLEGFIMAEHARIEQILKAKQKEGDNP